MLETRKENAMLDFPSQTAIGALVGSILSVWWRKALRWQANLAAGFFIGWWGGEWLIAYMGWPDTVETARAVGSALGLIGYSLLDFAMRTDWGQLAGRALEKAAAMRGVGK
jgi:hypothetical protein